MNYWLSCFFGLNLSQKFYVHPDNLSRTLQQKEMSAVKGWELADLSVKTLQALQGYKPYKRYKDISMPKVRRMGKCPIHPPVY